MGLGSTEKIIMVLPLLGASPGGSVSLWPFSRVVSYDHRPVVVHMTTTLLSLMLRNLLREHMHVPSSQQKCSQEG